MQSRRTIRFLMNLRRGPEIITAYRRAADWLQLSLRYLGLMPQSFPYEPVLRDGLRFRFESREEIKVFWNIFFRSSYHVDPDDRLILDAGANIGLFAVWAARVAPRARIFSLEPWPATFDRLTRTIEVNGLSDRVVAVKVALAGQSGWRELLGAEADSCNRKIRLDRDPPDSGRPAPGGALAACRTLEAVLDECGIATLDLLKMDIEGSEYETLLATRPAVLRRIRKIDLEYHEVAADLGYSRQQLFAHLAAAGHVPIRVIEDEFRTGMALFQQAGR